MGQVFRERAGYFGTKMIKLCGYAMNGGKRSNNFFIKEEMSLEFDVRSFGFMVFCLANSLFLM